MSFSLVAPADRSRLVWPVFATVLVVGWSSGFVGIRFANAEANFCLLLFWRTFLAGVILLPLALHIGPRLHLQAVVWQMGFGILSADVYLGGVRLRSNNGCRPALSP